MSKSIYAVALSAVLLFSVNAFAEIKPVACSNPDIATVYTNFYAEDEGSYKVPKGSIAYVDVLLRTIYGMEFVSGVVTRGDKILRVKGNQRWYLDLNEWNCLNPDLAEKMDA